MEEQESAGPGSPQNPRDGSIDFARYSLEQLNDLRFTLDRNAFPVNYANLIAELERRVAAGTSAEPHPTPAPDPNPGSAPLVEPSDSPHEPSAQPVSVRFTSHAGLLGWLEAKSRRLPLYGSGFVEVRAQEVVLGGWQRNWLGIGQRTELFIPARDISDVIQGDGTDRERDWVRFRYETPLGRRRFVECQMQSQALATALVDSLPKARSDTYDAWTKVREYDARLREVGSTPWIAPALVALNVIVFAVMAFATGHVNLLASPQVLEVGENFAPLTLNGQWWRLLSALFLHANLLHLLSNMWALWNVGKLTERLYGNAMFAFLYLAVGALSELTSIVWDPSRATIGASGAVFGVFAAFAVFSLHSERGDRVRVPATLWVSSVLFALYNLVAGFFSIGIDNAAHVGGVLSGALLGACLLRPLRLDARRRFPFARVALALGATGLCAAAAVWQATGLGDQLTGPERYLRAHEWYISGQTTNIRAWQEIGAQASAGQLSDEQVGERIEQDVLPFWRTAAARLQKEGTSSLPPDERDYGTVVLDYVRSRVAWGEALIAAVRGSQKDLALVRKLDQDGALLIARSQRLTMLTSLNHRPRALANSPWVLAVTNRVASLGWKCVEAPVAFHRTPGPQDAPEDSPVAAHAAGCKAQKLFMSADYGALDRWMDESRASLRDLPDGGSTLGAIIGGLGDLFEYRTFDVLRTLGRTADWQRQAPKSVYPELIQSLIFESWAWSARGTGFAKTVSPQAWALFAQRTEMAAASLEKVVERANDNPVWYELALDVGLDQSKATKELRATFDRGVIEEPGYWPLYGRMLRILMPRWHGEGAIKPFVDEVTARANGERDVAKYARLYWMYSSLEDDDVKLFGETLADWQTMKSGMAELHRQYPKSDVILNAYAKFACMAGDDPTYLEIRLQIDKRVSTLGWSQKVSMERCDGHVAKELAAARGRKFQGASFRGT
ncbi:MAG TPA: rhomboid family intramembrane serine protease [Steroidobacteraceae bacterium]|jgi:membrane associated rhomboid family serine protease